MHAPALGKLVAGKYRLDAIIGKGAGGIVYRAYNQDSGTDVALKLVHLEYALREDSRARFMREARLASSIKHPNVVEVLDFGAHESTLYLAMELLDGHDLRTELDHGDGFSAHAIAHLGAEVANALMAAHELGLVHRDIKPQNIFVEALDDGSQRIRVLDFGLAFRVNTDGSLGRLTEEGIVAGTPHYMSPEQASGDTVGPASDVYSLGCVLYEVAAQRPPFVGTVVEIMTRHLVVSPMPLQGLERPIPDPLAELIMAMLAKSPDQRPSSANALAALRDLERRIETGPIVQPRPQAALAVVALPDPTGDEPPAAAADSDDDAANAANAADDDHDAVVFSPTVRAPSQPIKLAPPEPDEVRIWLVGAVSEPVLMALRMAEMSPIMTETIDELAPEAHLGIRVAFMGGADRDDLARLRAHLEAGTPVLTSTGPERITELAQYVRAGFADVVLEPVHGDDLTRKIRRALRRAERDAGSRSSERLLPPDIPKR